MENINILFLGGAKRYSMAKEFINDGLLLNKKINIFSYELDENCPISFIGKVIIGEKWESENIYDHLSNVIEKHSIDIVIPFIDPATIILSKLQKFNKQSFFVTSNLKDINIFFDKIHTNQWCLDNDISVPNNDTEYFPLIAKPRRGSASKGIIKVEDKNSLQSIINKEDYLIQSFIKAKEYTVDIYRSFIDKKIISIVPRVRLETQGGESIKSITIKHDKIIKFSEDVILKTNLLGPITLQILEDDNGNIFFMEINPRYGGGVLNSIAAGCRSTSYLLNDFLGRKMITNSDWQSGLMMIRTFNERYKKITNNYANSN